MSIVLIDYNAGNVQSVCNAFRRLGVELEVTNDPEKIKSAEKVIFPGVAEASTTMAFLRESGLDKVLRELTQPFLGICLGMHVLCATSEEADTDCFGVYDIDIKRFQNVHKVPHMGWNTISNLNSPLFKDIDENAYVYFVHSFYAETNDYTIATCNYGSPFAAAIQKDNFYGVQFHPEKSADVGSKILKNFLEL